MTDLIAYFFAGALLANSLPHLANGLSGRAFPTPFARPRGVGVSSSTLNVLSGAVNLAAGLGLAGRVGAFDLHRAPHASAIGAGALLLGLGIARRFGAQFGGISPPREDR